MQNIKSSFDHFLSITLRKWNILGAMGVIAILSVVAVFSNAQTGEFEVRFFDVGQGDSALISMPDGRRILIDGGRDDGVVEKLSSAMPFWDKDIDIVVATHNDADHIGGLPGIFAHYNVATVIWNGIEVESKIFDELHVAMKNEGADIIVGRCCMRVVLSKNTFFEIVHPQTTAGPGPATSANQNQNDLSLVIRFVYGDTSILFTGDIERGVEYRIAESGFNLKSDILKVPHHGSKTSSSEAFLEIIDPEIVVISVGKNNSYGHPHESVLQRMEKYDIQVRRTDVEGDILFQGTKS